MSELKDHAVPETAAGILYQLERALYRLATCGPQDEVGVETDDDVTVLEPSGKSTSEQDKLSFQSTGHPFQDRGKGLWNTLSIWLKASSTGTPSQREAELHLVTNRSIPARAFVRALAKRDQTDEEIQSCIKTLRALGSDPADALEKLMPEVCGYTDAQLGDVIRRISLFDSSVGGGRGTIHNETLGYLHLPPDVDQAAVSQALLGWMHEVLMKAWEAKRPGWITRAAFDTQLDAIVRRERAQRKRERAERLVPVSEEERAAARGQPFVERLIEVELADDDISRAVECYVRFSTERFRLVEQGDIVVAEWDDFFDHLCERWDTIRRRIARNRADVPGEELGRRVFYGTADEGYLAPLAGRATDHSYFTSGGYHRLADDDRVWWHPDYQGKGTTSKKDEE